MYNRKIAINNRPFKLKNLIGRGGEGVVYSLDGDSEHAVKIYTTPELDQKCSKITAMVHHGFSLESSLAAFPISIVRGEHSEFLGFTMKLINDHKPIHELYSPGSRKKIFPHADYRFIVRTSANFAKAVASVHQAGCVIGDINHSGILVSQKGTVSLIDADSFQFSDSGRDFLCQVGVPEYTPPELQNIKLSTVLRNTNHDAFGLAVIIFQLLFMGRHPFVGRVRKGEIPPLAENIKNFRYVYDEDKDVGMDQPPGTPSLTQFSRPLASLFRSAFSETSPQCRPSAHEWAIALTSFENSLVQCKNNPIHYVPRGTSCCAWCEMEVATNTLLFLPSNTYFANISEQHESNFNITFICAELEQVSILFKNLPLPPLTKIESQPSAQAKDASKPSYTLKMFSFLMIIFSIYIFFVSTKNILISLMIACVGIFINSSNNQPDRNKFLNVYLTSDKEYNTALNIWRNTIGFYEGQKIMQSINSNIVAYKNLPNEEATLTQEYMDMRKEKQLLNFLSNFSLKSAKIYGIGLSRLTTLASYGIDTAADISWERVLGVPGFGPINSKGLLEWKASLEKRFRFRTTFNDDDAREISQIKSKIHTKSMQLRSNIIREKNAIEHLSLKIRSTLTQRNIELESYYSKLNQASTDLDYLKIPLPQQHKLTQTNTVSFITTTNNNNIKNQSSTPHCPRCGSVMIKRTARKGMHAGSPFWGCSRYPSCNGIVKF